MNNLELLAPAGNMSKFEVALRYGADAFYCGGHSFGLRAYADNFSFDELKTAAAKAHNKGKKIYVTVNIYADEDDLDVLPAYIEQLTECGIDAVIVSDLGVFSVIRKCAPDLDVHVSTQANITNSEAAKAWVNMGAKRIILARETGLNDIEKIKKAVGDTEIEAFVHGAMCISYSGRCLLSSYFTGRSGNKGACTQCCRWEYDLVEKKRGEPVTITEDGRGTYILSSRDLRMINHMKELVDAGVSSFKIEGRVKSEYYVAGVVNAYRRALNDVISGKDFNPALLEETEKISHRGYTTGFFYDEQGGPADESSPTASATYMADVLGYENGYIVAQMRNRFMTGDELEVLSPDDNFNRKIKIESIKVYDTGEDVAVADKVMQKILIKSDCILHAGDFLRKLV